MPFSFASMRMRPRLLMLAVTVMVVLAGCDTGVNPNADTTDTTPRVQFATSAETLVENDSTVTLIVELTNPDGEPVSVDVLFAQGASTASLSDIGLPPNDDVNGVVVESVTFSGGPDDTTRDLTFDIADDEVIEDRETALFALQNLTTRGRAQFGDNQTFRLEIGFPTLQEIREQNGLGDLVAFQATVTRARGDFAYVEDETGIGLTLRQTSGAFSQDVADGNIAPGTRIQASGTLSTFAGLLQINAGDLNGYAILSQGSVPEPTTVTLSELSEDEAEVYESTLVRVENLTFQRAGTFSNGENYSVSDGSGTSLIARVPGAGDTVFGGKPIPAEPVTFVGVLGQFNGDFGSNANGGYQLLLIEETDLR